MNCFRIINECLGGMRISSGWHGLDLSVGTHVNVETTEDEKSSDIIFVIV